MSKPALKPPGPEVLKAMASIASTRDWGLVEVWLCEEVEAAIQQSFSLDTTICRQTQGRILMGQMLIELFQKAQSRSQG
jgi:hypothetical protein